MSIKIITFTPKIPVQTKLHIITPCAVLSFGRLLVAAWGVFVYHEMNNYIDILEDKILKLDPEVLRRLLWDHSQDKFIDEKGCERHHHIYWATDAYQKEGEGYGFFDEITIAAITGEHSLLIRPRAVKSKEEQEQRTRDKAEVFTPVWVCNAQNNLIDNAWFGKDDHEAGIFNDEYIDENGVHQWRPRESKIPFPTKDGKTWQDYVWDTRLEITCGEAPYLVSRYDTTTGEPITDLNKRIGMLDRKLRVVGENVDNTEDWLYHAFCALKSCYGFEWQGDSLLLAREAILYTFKDYYDEFCRRIGKAQQISNRTLEKAAYIISWNLFQMDGIKFNLPCSGDRESEILKTGNLFGDFDDQQENTFSQIPPLARKKVFAKVAQWQKKGEANKQVFEFRQLTSYHG